MLLSFEEKVTGIVTAIVVIVTFAWNYFGRPPRMRFSSSSSDGVVHFKAVVQNPGGQPFTVDKAVTKRGRLVTTPMIWFIGDPYEYWPAGASVSFDKLLSPGEQHEFSVFVADSGSDELKIKLKRTTSFREPRSYDLVVF